MNRRPVRPSGPIRALEQWAATHPRVEWLLTRYPVRRWRAVCRWPPVIMLLIFDDSVRERVPHPDWRVKLGFDALYLASLGVVLAADACLQWRARRLVGSRSRGAYLAAGVALLGVAAGAVAVGWPAFVANTWPGDVYGLIAGVSGWSAILAFGRGLVHGPQRRWFWVYPPGGDAELRASEFRG